MVDLTSIEMANAEDKLYHRDLWAAFFKSKSWEELKMLAEKDEYIAESLPFIKQLTDDECFRMKCEAREDHIRQENDMKLYYEKQIQERDEQLASKDKVIKQLKSEINKIKNNQ